MRALVSRCPREPRSGADLGREVLAGAGGAGGDEGGGGPSWCVKAESPVGQPRRGMGLPCPVAGRQRPGLPQGTARRCPYQPDTVGTSRLTDHEKTIWPPERVILFSCADRLGREIVLYEDTWYDHILARRAVLAGHETAVLATLEAAEHIRIDRRDQNRRCSHRLGVLPPPNGYDFVKVIVEFDAEHPLGVVVTAFTVDGPNPNESWEY